MIYDELINEILALPGISSAEALPVNTGETEPLWPLGNGREMILRSDAAYELGGGTLPGTGLTAVSVSKDTVPADGIFLIGRDLPEITADAPFARIALLRVSDDIPTEGQRFYRLMKDLDFTKYHFNPKGFMPRISSIERRECVRVGRKAFEDGIDFSKVGSLMIQAFHKNRAVEAVSLFYVTDEDFDFRTLKEIDGKVSRVTEAIEHIGTMPDTDCDTCGLKSICDEVEGLRQLHFGTNKGLDI